MVRDAGHEIGLHGYSHENPIDMSMEQQRDILDKTYRMLTDFCGGKPPRGTVAPWWEVSKEATELFLSYGIEYDHSMSHEDCQPYYLRTGDSWTKINYENKAETWMKPLVKGKETGMVEIPANWYIDDLPPMMFMKKVPNSHGFANARDIEDIWRVSSMSLIPSPANELCRTISTISTVNMTSSYVSPCSSASTSSSNKPKVPMTIHPDVSGRPHALLMHERLIEHINKHEGVEWVTMGEMADDFKSKNKPAEGAMMPAPPGEILKKQEPRLS